MKPYPLLLLLPCLFACGKGVSPPERGQAAQSSAPVAAIAAKPAAMDRMIPVPKEEAQLNRMLAMGYTVHDDHMHPPGVKECAFDKASGSVVQ